MKTYTIGEKTYTQSPLVIGQVARLLTELRGVEITTFDALSLVSAFGERLPRLLACILIPDGQSAATVDISALATELFAMPADLALEVVDDFLAWADLASLSARLTQILNTIATRLPTPATTAGPENSAPSSPEATP